MRVRKEINTSKSYRHVAPQVLLLSR